MTTTSSTLVSSLTSSLGIDTGINVSTLVSSLTDAAFSQKFSTVNSRLSTTSSQISALASAKSAMDTFSSALTKLLKSSSYTGQPGTTDPTIASVTALAGGTPTGLPATIQVNQIAQAQVLKSVTPLADAEAVAGTGTLTLSVDGTDYDITLGASNNTLQDLADEINDSGANVTASIVTDTNGARLVLKGETGADQAFTLTDSGDADTELLRFTWDGSAGSMARQQQALNAEITIDGVDMEFTSNTVTTAIPNLSIELNKAAPGTKVTIATDQPTATMTDLVKEIVDAYNTLKGSLNTATRAGDGSTTSSGLLQNDSGVRQMVNSLSKLTSTTLNPDGTYQTLSSIGVQTNRDGTLTLDEDMLSKALAADPEGVVQMLNPTVQDDTHRGIAGALNDITTYLEGTSGPLTSSENSYKKLSESLQDQLDKLNTQQTAYSAQLNTTYTSLQTKLLSIKATQSYLEQQIAAWNE